MLHFVTCKIEPVGSGLDEDEFPYRMNYLTRPTLAIISVFPNWSATETVISPWDGTEKELLQLARTNPKKFVLYALEHMDTEYADFIDGLINDGGDDEICINGREVHIDW